MYVFLGYLHLHIGGCVRMPAFMHRMVYVCLKGANLRMCVCNQEVVGLVYRMCVHSEEELACMRHFVTSGQSHLSEHQNCRICDAHTHTLHAHSYEH